jgi:uncharacterized membrane protein YgcG
MNPKTRTRLINGIWIAIIAIIVATTLAILANGQAEIAKEKIVYNDIPNAPVRALALIPPGRDEYVIDMVDVLTPEEERDLRLSLEALANSMDVEMTIFTVPNFSPLEPDQYSAIIAEVWEHNAETDRWVLLAIGVEDGEIRYDTSTKLATILTPEKIAAISKNRVEPQVKAGDYYMGFNEAVLAFGGQIGNK